MYFETSNDIRRETDFNVSDIRKIDAYLARPNLKTFTLFSVQSGAELGEIAEPLFGEYVRRRIVCKPYEAYLCPVHRTTLELSKWRKAWCVDCDTEYKKADCTIETRYRRIKNPEQWPPSKGPTIHHPPPVREPPLWKDRRFLIPIILFCLHLPLTLYLHFNPYSPPDISYRLPASRDVSETQGTENTPDVAPPKTPLTKAVTPDADPSSSATLAANSINPVHGE